MLLKFGEERVVIAVNVVRPETKVVNLGILRLKQDLSIEIPSQEAMG